MNALQGWELEEIREKLEAADYSEMETEIEKRFQIDGLSGANWCFRKIVALREEIHEKKRLAEEEMERIRQWFQDETGRFERDVEFFEGRILEWYRQMREQDDKFRLKTPYGSVSARKSENWEYDDEKLLKSLKDCGLDDLIRVKEEPAKSDLKSARKDGRIVMTEEGVLVTADGEVVEGVRISRQETLSVKTAENTALKRA